MPNPIEAAVGFLTSVSGDLPAGHTRGTNFPTADIAKVHVQYAWDGTPADADNREDVVLRFTVWAPKGQPTTAAEVAADLRALLVGYSSDLVQRITRGTGRLPGIDPDTGLPFCMFTATAVLRAL